MSNFIFNAAAAALTAATLDLSTGSYYAHLVTTTPLLTDSTVSNLVVSTASGYAPTTLTGLSDNSQRWTFDSFTFPRYIFAVTPPVGVVICKRAGASPANSDQIICYSDFLNSIGQVILTPVGAYLISLSFGAGGAINKTYRYQYSSGAYVANADGGFPKGLLYLLGSSNNTVSFVNPLLTKIVGLASGTVGGLLTDASDTTDRTSNGYFRPEIVLDFKLNTVRVSDFRYLLGQAGSATVNLYGSNTLSSWTPAVIRNLSNWTVLATPVTDQSAPGWKSMPVSNNTYWRYLYLTGSTASIYINEIELYSSSLLSPTANMT